MFRKEDCWFVVVVVVVVEEDGLGEHAPKKLKKTLFTQEKNFTSR
jgi:hypothetical protein